MESSATCQGSCLGEWKNYNFKIRAIRHNRGRINIFKIYEIEVLLEVVK